MLSYMWPVPPFSSSSQGATALRCDQSSVPFVQASFRRLGMTQISLPLLLAYRPVSYTLVIATFSP